MGNIVSNNPDNWFHRKGKVLKNSAELVNKRGSEWRSDIKNLYNGYPQRYGSYIVNMDYTKPSKGKFDAGYAVKAKGYRNGKSVFDREEWKKLPKFGEEKSNGWQQWHKGSPVYYQIVDGENMGAYSMFYNTETGEKSYNDLWDISGGPFMYGNIDVLGTPVSIYDKQK